MAAATASLNNYLTGTLGLTNALAARINEQGISSFDELKEATDKDIKAICQHLRKPGGVLPNPAYDPTNVVPGIPPTIPDVGIQVPFMTEKHLKLLAYYLRHLERTQKPMAAATASMARLIIVGRIKEREETEKDEPTPKVPDKLEKVSKVRKMIEDLDDHFSKRRGTSGVFLTYVIRIEEDPDPAAVYATDDDEMISRAPLTGQYYQQDKVVVWDVIRSVLYDTDGWSWVSSHARSKDGRAAYMSLRNHYLGSSHQAKILTDAERIIDTTFYDGEKRGFTFERYCQMHKQAHVDLSDYKDPYNEPKKVRKFIRGIRAPSLQAPAAFVLGSEAHMADFDMCVNYVSRFVEQRDALQLGGRNVSSLMIGGRGRGDRGGGRFGGRGGGRGRGRGSFSGRSRGGRRSFDRGSGRGIGRGGSGRAGAEVTDRYYTSEEWERLAPEQRERVRELRNERDRRRNMSSTMSHVDEDRQVRQRITFSNAQESDDNQNASGTATRGIGATMSRRSALRQGTHSGATSS